MLVGGNSVRVEHIGDATLYLGDCRDVLPTLDRTAAIISDPPYGMKWNTNCTRFSGGDSAAQRGKGRSDWGAIAEDDAPFDPAPWLTFPKVVLWGSNHFAARLPVGTTLMWLKRKDGGFGSFLSDGELAWMKGGHGVYARRDTSLMGQTRNRVHPTQKPVGIMEWCIEKCGNPALVVDPYMGSGTTGIAAVRKGLRFIGVERDERYFEAACERIFAATVQPSMFEVAA